MTGLPGSLRYVAQCRGSELARRGVGTVAGDKQEGSRGKGTKRFNGCFGTKDGIQARLFGVGGLI